MWGEAERQDLDMLLCSSKTPCGATDGKLWMTQPAPPPSVELYCHLLASAGTTKLVTTPACLHNEEGSKERALKDFSLLVQTLKGKTRIRFQWYHSNLPFLFN